MEKNQNKDIKEITGKAETLSQKLTRLHKMVAEELQLTVANVKAEQYNYCNDYLENHTPNQSFALIISQSAHEKIAGCIAEFKKHAEIIMEYGKELATNETRLLQAPENLYEANQRNELLTKINEADKKLVGILFRIMCYQEVYQTEQFLKIQKSVNRPIINIKP
jgi:flagellar biosynthesis/type III secretory pathway chaperone